MRTILCITALTLAIPTLAIVSARAQSPNALEGAWELTETTAADAADDVTGMLIFSFGHYSWIRANSRGRPSYTSQAEATDAQRVAAFNSFAANAGSYTVSGTTLTRDPTVGKNTYVYAPGNTLVSTFTIEGNTLTITFESGRVDRYRRLD